MISFGSYCRQLAVTGQPASSEASNQLVGNNQKKRSSFQDSCTAWWRTAIRRYPSWNEDLFCPVTRTKERTAMASTKRLPDQKTLAAPRGRRVSLTLTEGQYRKLSYLAGRFRLTPCELLRGMLLWLPDFPAWKFTKILLDTTKGRGR